MFPAAFGRQACLSDTGYLKRLEASMGYVSLLIVALIACEGPHRSDRSTPVEPTMELGDPAGMGVKWSTLEGFITSEAPALPSALGGLRFGQPEAEVRAALNAIHDARVKMPRVVDLEGDRILGATLAEFEGVAVTAFVDLSTGTLREIDVSLPADEALYVLTKAWGEPEMRADPNLGPVAVWTNAETGLRVELSRHNNLGVAKFRPGS